MVSLIESRDKESFLFFSNIHRKIIDNSKNASLQYLKADSILDLLSTGSLLVRSSFETVLVWSLIERRKACTLDAFIAIPAKNPQVPTADRSDEEES